MSDFESQRAFSCSRSVREPETTSQEKHRIEKINRGNAAAIFGELFQLLDRLEQDEGGSSNGERAGDSDFAPFIPKENFERYKENIGIRLPPTFSIFATMNTSDLQAKIDLRKNAEQ